ncbi:MAG TPA: hypothetical protein VHL30_00340 [Chlamydiales bacterium]|jgi:hypothetical protein|nr:hypothetical protein [Chlamydiales bacterium]
MLEFLRKYQKYFFFVIATMVISSIVFFGTFGAVANPEKREDKAIGKAIDGSDLKLLAISALARFLSSDRDDLASARKQGSVNLLNDGVIRKDLLATGIADILIRGNYELFKAQLDHKFQRVKTYRSYEHPEAPFVSAKAMWQRFAPDINREWSFLQSENSCNEETFSHLVNLYQLQSALPSEWLRRVLVLHEQQYNWLHPDPRLRQDDLSLFGFHSLSDWFGKDFVDLMAQFIYNAAILAEQQGYKVSLEEAKGDLKRNFSESMQRLQAAKWPIELNYKEQLRILGMDEREAATVWRKVLLFRRYFQDLGESAFLDRLPYTEFSALAKEKAVIDLYQWPSSLKMTTALDLYSFQTYLKAVSPMAKNGFLKPPSSLFSVAEVEKKTPELVGVEYRAKVFAVDKREASLRAPLKEVWEYETDEEAWKRLRNEFSFLQPFSVKTPEERFQVLEKLGPEQRGKVDFLARRLLVDKHPEWTKESLELAEGKDTRLILCNGRIELPHIDDPQRLGTLFSQILSSPEVTLSALHHFETEEAVFRFENIEKISEPRIKTYEEARNDGSLDKLIDHALQKEFSTIRGKLPPEKAVKELSEVKEDVADLLLADWKKVLEKERGGDTDVPLVALYWKSLALQAKEDLSANQNEHFWLKAEDENPLLAQFKMERIEKEITRTAEEDWMAKEPFVLVPNQWSPVHTENDGGVHFIFLKNRFSSEEPILEQLSFGKAMLAADVQRLLAEKLLHTMRQKHALMIPLQPEQE